MDKKIFIAGGLLSRYPLICKTIYEVCEKEGVEFGILSGVKNIWIRDYMPISTYDGKHIKFEYTADSVKYPILEDSAKPWSWIPNYSFGRIFLDGGNCVMGENIAFITHKVLKDNVSGVVRVLEEFLKVPVCIIPAEPDDTLGHADGILNFAPDGSVFINAYGALKSKKYDKYLDELIRIVESAGFKWSLFPYAYHKMPKITEKEFRIKYPYADEFNPAYGYYINYLKVGNTIILPVFGIEEDQQAMKMFPGLNVEPVNCSDLSMEGGLIRCVTWESYR